MASYTTTQSDALYERAGRVVPGGIFGHYGYAVRPRGPKFFAHAEGSRFTDVDGNEYVDWMCAYGPMILGYGHPAVDQAAAEQMARGNTVSLAAPVMVELAEALVEMVDAADWAVFGKNGGDATSLAVMLARAATGRRCIVKVADGYHGAAPWMQAGRPGTIDADGKHVLSVPWNDAAAFERLVAERGDDIACFISSPYDHPVMRDNTLPADGYWPAIERICRQRGIVLIVDDVRAGFRIDLAGSNVAYGFRPDLICFGKALGNGHPISALVGSDALRDTAREVYYSGTQFFNAAPMAAALATLRELAAADAARRMSETGERLNSELVKIAAQRGFNLVVSGVPAMPYYRLDGVSTDTHFRWIDECVARGAYLLGYHNHFVSLAHTEADLQRTWDAADQAFAVLERTED